jgi:4'-phosphopantetheinyl transferase
VLLNYFVEGDRHSLRVQTADSVDVYSVRLNATEPVVESLVGILDDAERERASRYKFPSLRNAFVQAHAAVRIFAGKYLFEDPQRIQFDYNAKGKPRIRTGELEFNLSHSGSLIALAFARRCQVGIDIEEFRSLTDRDAMVEQYFTIQERAKLRTIDPSLHDRAFLAAWTRKEAYLKARGVGIAGLDEGWSVTMRPGEEPRLLVLPEQSRDNTWQVHDLAIRPEFVSALAYSGSRRNICIFTTCDLERLLEA